MRILFVVLALLVSAVLPRTSSAAEESAARPAAANTEPSLASELPAVFRTLGAALISGAHAAECTREGETCTSNEQCCPGLECSGGPPATCVEED